MSTAAQQFPEAEAGLEIGEAKEAMRRAIRAQRAQLSARTRARAATDLAQVVGDIPEVRSAACVAAYVARPTEPGTTPLLDRLAGRGTKVLLPVLGSGLQRTWAWLTSTDEFEVRAPGRPPEPLGPTLPGEALVQAEAIVVPALAVDSDGWRLGQGGGWYDRVLEHARPGALVVAMVFTHEVFDVGVRPVPREEHDRPVDVVATPLGWRRLRTGTSAGA